MKMDAKFISAAIFATVQFTACFIGSWPRSVGQNTTCFCVVRVPEPVLPGLAANKAPLFIQLADKGDIGMSDWRGCHLPRYEFFRFCRINGNVLAKSTLTVFQTASR
ncbi:hypothetical protein DH20_16670 [Pantoea agglomerans]|nr:hypothetical protein [Pantoea agglomerans]